MTNSVPNELFVACRIELSDPAIFLSVMGGQVSVGAVALWMRLATTWDWRRAQRSLVGKRKWGCAKELLALIYAIEQRMRTSPKRSPLLLLCFRKARCSRVAKADEV